MPRGQQTSKQVAREAVREELWPNSGALIWPQPSEKGWTRTPRTLPIVAEIINSKKLSGGESDLARTYLTLYCMAFEEGIIEIIDEETVATVSGLKKKTWIARMVKLAELGLIEVKPKGPHRFGYVLLNHPVPVVRRLHKQGLVEEHLWTLFVQWHKEYKATEPEEVAMLAAPAATPTSEELDENLGVPSTAKLGSVFAGLKKKNREPAE